ncbi:MAG: MBL fold metallo-hydrolase [Bryobacteraceae bacterium]|nr:MBL fold metallo-hydrolase [Bryobacteraceae bacterium]
MIHEILPVGVLACNCSIFGDEASGEALVIDPGDDVEQILQIVARYGLRVTAIFITHAHIDHVGGAAKLKEATGAPVYLNDRDLELYEQLDWQAAWLGIPMPARTGVDVSPRDGDTLRVGAAEFTVLHTPGHTPGSVSLWLPAEGKLMAGDTLFRDSIGRTDLPGGNSRLILASIRDKLLTLPEETLVIPGHGPETTIGREKEYNWFLRGL